MASSSYSPSISSATQRRPSHSHTTPQDPTVSNQQCPVSDPAPNPKPVFQYLAAGLVVFLGLLQVFLHATHLRDPSDPFMNWVSVNRNSHYSDKEGHLTVSSNGGDDDDGFVRVVSWMECLDLRVISVLVNSTLSSSRYPDLVYFDFFLPGGNEDKLSFYKLKVLFPHSNIEFHGQGGVKQLIRNTVSGEEYTRLNFEEIVPFVIPSFYKSLKKFIYVSPNVIVKGRVEELIGTDLSTYAVAAPDDCSEKLSTYVNLDVLDAVQRSASKPWVSETPYKRDACMPDLSVVLIDVRKLRADFLEAFRWWTKVLNWSDQRSNRKNPAVALALYNRYLKLDDTWLITASQTDGSMVIHYDGPKNTCSESGNGVMLPSNKGRFWKRYLPPLANQILGS